MFTVPSETCALGDSCPAHTIPSPCPSPGKGSGWLIPHVAGRPPFSGDGLSMAPAPRWEAPGLPVGFAGKDSLKCGQDRHWLSGQGLPPRSAHNPTASPLCSREVAAGGPDRGERGVAGLRWAEPGLQSGHSGGTSSPLHSSVSPSLSERHSETPTRAPSAPSSPGFLESDRQLGETSDAGPPRFRSHRPAGAAPRVAGKVVHSRQCAHRGRSLVFLLCDAVSWWRWQQQQWPWNVASDETAVASQTGKECLGLTETATPLTACCPSDDVKGGTDLSCGQLSRLSDPPFLCHWSTAHPRVCPPLLLPLPVQSPRTWEPAL